MSRHKPIRRPEQMLQRACVQLLEAFYEPMLDVFWTAINPIPAKSKAAAGISKAMGMRAGVPDMIFIQKPMTGVHSRVLFIEFKAPGGRYSESQETLIPKISRTNSSVEMADSIEDFVAILNSWGIQPRRKLTLRSTADEYLTNHL